MALTRRGRDSNPRRRNLPRNGFRDRTKSLQIGTCAPAGAPVARCGASESGLAGCPPPKIAPGVGARLTGRALAAARPRTLTPGLEFPAWLGRRESQLLKPHGR